MEIGLAAGIRNLPGNEQALHWGVEFYRRRGVPMPNPPVGEMQFQASGMQAVHVQRSMRSFARHLMPEIARWGRPALPA